MGESDSECRTSDWLLRTSHFPGSSCRGDVMFDRRSLARDLQVAVNTCEAV